MWSHTTEKHKEEDADDVVLIMSKEEQDVNDFKEEAKKTLFCVIGLESENEHQFITAVDEYRRLLNSKAMLLSPLHLKDAIIRDLIFINSNFRRICITYTEKYLDIMEKIMFSFCSVICECVRSRRIDLLSRKQEGRKVIILLRDCLLGRCDRIAHVLMKMNVRDGDPIVQKLYMDIFWYFLFRMFPYSQEEDLLRGFVVYFMFLELFDEHRRAELIEALPRTLKSSTYDLKKIPVLREIYEDLENDSLMSYRDMCVKYKIYREKRGKTSTQFLDSLPSSTPRAMFSHPRETQIEINRSNYYNSRYSQPTFDDILAERRPGQKRSFLKTDHSWIFKDQNLKLEYIKNNIKKENTIFKLDDDVVCIDDGIPKAPETVEPRTDNNPLHSDSDSDFDVICLDDESKDNNEVAAASSFLRRIQLGMECADEDLAHNRSPDNTQPVQTMPTSFITDDTATVDLEPIPETSHQETLVCETLTEQSCATHDKIISTNENLETVNDVEMNNSQDESSQSAADEIPPEICKNNTDSAQATQLEEEPHNTSQNETTDIKTPEKHPDTNSINPNKIILRVKRLEMECGELFQCQPVEIPQINLEETNSEAVSNETATLRLGEDEQFSDLPKNNNNNILNETTSLLKPTEDEECSDIPKNKSETNQIMEKNMEEDVGTLNPENQTDITPTVEPMEEGASLDTAKDNTEAGDVAITVESTDQESVPENNNVVSMEDNMPKNQTDEEAPIVNSIEDNVPTEMCVSTNQLEETDKEVCVDNTQEDEAALSVEFTETNASPEPDEVDTQSVKSTENDTCSADIPEETEEPNLQSKSEVGGKEIEEQAEAEVEHYPEPEPTTVIELESIPSDWLVEIRGRVATGERSPEIDTEANVSTVIQPVNGVVEDIRTKIVQENEIIEHAVACDVPEKEATEMLYLLKESNCDDAVPEEEPCQASPIMEPESPLPDAIDSAKFSTFFYNYIHRPEISAREFKVPEIPPARDVLNGNIVGSLSKQESEIQPTIEKPSGQMTNFYHKFAKTVEIEDPPTNEAEFTLPTIPLNPKIDIPKEPAPVPLTFTDNILTPARTPDSVIQPAHHNFHSVHTSPKPPLYSPDGFDPTPNQFLPLTHTKKSKEHFESATRRMSPHKSGHKTHREKKSTRKRKTSPSRAKTEINPYPDTWNDHNVVAAARNTLGDNLHRFSMEGPVEKPISQSKNVLDPYLWDEPVMSPVPKLQTYHSEQETYRKVAHNKPKKTAEFDLLEQELENARAYEAQDKSYLNYDKSMLPMYNLPNVNSHSFFDRLKVRNNLFLPYYGPESDPNLLPAQKTKKNEEFSSIAKTLTETNNVLCGEYILVPDLPLNNLPPTGSGNTSWKDPLDQNRLVNLSSDTNQHYTHPIHDMYSSSGVLDRPDDLDKACSTPINLSGQYMVNNYPAHQDLQENSYNSDHKYYPDDAAPQQHYKLPYRCPLQMPEDLHSCLEYNTSTQPKREDLPPKKRPPPRPLGYTPERQMSIADVHDQIPKIKTVAEKKQYADPNYRVHSPYPEGNYNKYNNSTVTNVFITDSQYSTNGRVILILNADQQSEQQAGEINQHPDLAQPAPTMKESEWIGTTDPIQNTLPETKPKRGRKRAAPSGAPSVKRGRGRPRKNVH